MSVQKHYLLVAFPGFGHIIPLLGLARKISRYHRVTFAVSACMTKKILDRGLMKNANCSLVGIPDNYMELHGDSACAISEPSELDDMLGKVWSGARKFLQEVLIASDGTKDGTNKIPVDVVIGDPNLASALTVCHDRNVPYHLFITSAIRSFGQVLVVDDNTPVMPHNHDHGHGKGFEEAPNLNSHNTATPISYSAKASLLPLQKSLHLISGLVVNSVRAVDQDDLTEMRRFPPMKDIPVRFVGPLISDDENKHGTHQTHNETVLNWLNQQKPQTVIYVSFGSVVSPTPEQLVEIGQALLLLNRPFIWSISERNQQHIPEELLKKLSTDRSLILSWAPQNLILQDPAVGVFVSHCGWNSTMESLHFGVPIVAWPLFADQKLNADFLVKHGMAVKLEGTGAAATHSIPPAKIADVIREVAGESSTGNLDVSKYRQAVAAFRESIGGTGPSLGSSDKELLDLLEAV